MKKTIKISSVLGGALFVLAALFSVSLFLVLFDFGGRNPASGNFLFKSGKMFVGVYGFCSILIPVFLIAAAFQCFAKKWTLRNGIVLLGSVIPFFTFVALEHIMKMIASANEGDVLTMKLITSAITGLVVVTIEYLVLSVIGDFAERKSESASQKIADETRETNENDEQKAEEAIGEKAIENKNEESEEQVESEKSDFDFEIEAESENEEKSEVAKIEIEKSSEAEIEESKAEIEGEKSSETEKSENESQNDSLETKNEDAEIEIRTETQTNEVAQTNPFEHIFDKSESEIEFDEIDAFETENRNDFEKLEIKNDSDSSDFQIQNEGDFTKPKSEVAESEIETRNEKSESREAKSDFDGFTESDFAESFSDDAQENQVEETKTAESEDEFKRFEDEASEKNQNDFSESEIVDTENASDEDEIALSDSQAQADFDDLSGAVELAESELARSEIEEEIRFDESGASESQNEAQDEIREDFEETNSNSIETTGDEDFAKNEKGAENDFAEADFDDNFDTDENFYVTNETDEIQENANVSVSENDSYSENFDEDKAFFDDSSIEQSENAIGKNDPLCHDLVGIFSEMEKDAANASGIKTENLSDSENENNENRQNDEADRKSVNAVEISSDEVLPEEIIPFGTAIPIDPEELIDNEEFFNSEPKIPLASTSADRFSDAENIESKTDDFSLDDITESFLTDDSSPEENQNSAKNAFEKLVSLEEDFESSIGKSIGKSVQFKNPSPAEKSSPIQFEKTMRFENEAPILAEKTSSLNSILKGNSLSLENATLNSIQTENKDEENEVEEEKPEKKYLKLSEYEIPSDILNTYPNGEYWIVDEETKKAAADLKATLNEFKIEAEVTGIRKGPVVTMFEILPAPGVKLSKIVTLQDNIALRLAASSVRIVAPIPGKHAVGIEVPNKERAIVSFREIVENPIADFDKMAIPVILGKDISGEPQVLDLAKTPHLLIAGSTGAGKSVCVNSMLLSILYKRSPRQVKLVLIDPKIVELKLYNDIPHLLTPVITDSKRALQSLQYCLCEMERRYAMLDAMGVRDITSYNRRIVERKICQEKLPYIVVIIDEFADLMATTGKELESTIARLAAMSRAVGIHLVLATQRPSIDVITGLIKANIPSRIAFMVASKMDSRIIIDQLGAEKLLGKGDMLYNSATDPFPVRIQGALVSDDEVERVVDYVKQFGEPEYIDDEMFVDDDDDDNTTSLFNDGEDPLYDQALQIVVQAGKASASYIQRKLKIGYNRAARLVEEMEARGIVGPANGSKAREIIHMV